VEKPVYLVVEEGRKMVEAARKYNRVVQAGTMQRLALDFQQACDIVRRGELGRSPCAHVELREFARGRHRQPAGQRSSARP